MTSNALPCLHSVWYKAAKGKQSEYMATNCINTSYLVQHSLLTMIVRVTLKPYASAQLQQTLSGPSKHRGARSRRALDLPVMTTNRIDREGACILIE